jgi:hypothetical protein
MLKQPFPSNIEWNEMLRFKLIPMKLRHEMIIQMDEEKETTKVTLDIVETNHQSQRGVAHKGKKITIKEPTTGHLPLIKKSQVRSKDERQKIVFILIYFNFKS